MGFDLEGALAQKREASLHRRRRLIGSAQCSRLVVDGRELVNFCSNDYLGLASHPRLTTAMERVIELRESGMNIRVCNMSLGGSTIAPGTDIEDQVVDAMLSHDIVTVIAAGSSGPATLTNGSPGSARSALTVGAASLAHNERILRDVQYGAGVGALYRPYSGAEMAYFSARGPNADGRTDLADREREGDLLERPIPQLARGESREEAAVVPALLAEGAIEPSSPAGSEGPARIASFRFPLCIRAVPRLRRAAALIRTIHRARNSRLRTLRSR